MEKNMKAQDLISAIKNGECNGIFSELYGRDAVDAAIERYTECINEYLSLYGDGDLSVFSVGGRSELMGNHTDHNKGKVIATSISRDIIAVASPVSGNTIRVKSKGHEENSVDLNDLVPSEKRYYTSNELTRGVCAGFVKEGYKVSAFNAYTSSEVLSGSGLSSSAAFEVMLGNILNHLFNAGKVSSIKIAEIAQYAENVFYGKPSGLMDQMACAYGGLITIDFERDGSPLIEKLESDFLRSKYKLCIIYPGGSHASLNEDYASIPSEMKSVASYFGKEVLRGTDIKKVVDEVAELRNKYGDRAVLRA
ncbi:MAG: galactokinase, partial [Ruminococcaceae bacterium]|nr:galactokinase [Oscillospiraceae bacterium]